MNFVLFMLVSISVQSAEASIKEAKFLKVVSPSNPPAFEDRSFAFQCVSECGRSLHCGGTIVLSSLHTCSFLTEDEVENLATFDEVLYKKTFPPPPTCQNGGVWFDSTKTSCICTGSFTGTYCERYWEDCSEGFSLGSTTDGVYTIQPRLSPTPFQTYCQMKWGGRTYVQKQEKGIDFYRTWQDYKEGFGNLNNDHWLGLEKIKNICDSHLCRLMVHIDYAKSQPTWRQSFFHDFILSNETDGYRLYFSSMSVSGSSNNHLSDGLTDLKGASFSTHDRDNDDNPGGSCAQTHYSGWWFKNCSPSNLNGKLKPIPKSTSGKPTVVFWPGDTRGAKSVYMCLRTYY